MQRKRTPPIKDVISSAYSLCFAIGHHIDPVDVFELLHAGLDTAHQRPDFSTVQPNVDIDPSDDPYLARADERGQDFGNAGDTGVHQEEGSCTLAPSGPQWLGETGNIAVLLLPGGRHPGADQEVVVTPDEPKADSDKRQPDEHGGHSLR